MLKKMGDRVTKREKKKQLQPIEASIHLLEVRKDLLERWKSYKTPLEEKLPKDSRYRDHYLQLRQNNGIRKAM